MPINIQSISLLEAKAMLSAGEDAAQSIQVAYNIAVVDAAGHLIAFTRQDGALIGSIDLALCKAKTACLFSKSTEYLAKLAQPGAPLFGIDKSNHGEVVIFGGGVPVFIDGRIVGAVGTSAGTVEQDVQVANAAASAYRAA